MSPDAKRGPRQGLAHNTITTRNASANGDLPLAVRARLTDLELRIAALEARGPVTLAGLEQMVREYHQHVTQVDGVGAAMSADGPRAS